jgi:protein PhnA
MESVKARSGQVCELSGSTENLVIYAVLPQDSATEDNTVYITEKCVAQIEKTEAPESSFWQGFLGDAMWSEVPGIKVLSWRMLNRFKAESWANDLLDMLYIEDETLEWAKALGEEDNEVDAAVVHKDSNGNILSNGDTVTLTKTLDVKGSSISAKIGTAVRNIRLVEDNAEQIEGKVDGQLIVILTKYVKKQG